MSCEKHKQMSAILENNIDEIKKRTIIQTF